MRVDCDSKYLFNSTKTYPIYRQPYLFIFRFQYRSRTTSLQTIKCLEYQKRSTSQIRSAMTCLLQYVHIETPRNQIKTLHKTLQLVPLQLLKASQSFTKQTY